MTFCSHVSEGSCDFLNASLKQVIDSKGCWGLHNAHDPVSQILRPLFVNDFIYINVNDY